MCHDSLKFWYFNWATVVLEEVVVATVGKSESFETDTHWMATDANKWADCELTWLYAVKQLLLFVQKLKSLVRWWIYRCKRRILISRWTQIETHRWTTGSIQAWGTWGSWWPWRSWGSLHSRLTLLRDLELQPAMLDRASPHWPCQHNNLTLHCK